MPATGGFGEQRNHSSVLWPKMRNVSQIERNWGQIARKGHIMRCVVVGVGNLAVGHYLPFLAAQNGMELGYLARTSERSSHAQEQFGGTVLESWRDVASFAPDIVFNLTTDSQHGPVLEELVQIGCPRIFSEKPLVAAHGQASVDESDFDRAMMIAAAARQAHVEIALGFNYRFFDTVRASIELMSRANFGDASTIVASAHYACWSHTIDLIGLVSGPMATLSAIAERADDNAQDAAPPSRAVSFTTTAGAVGTLSGSSRRAWSDELFSLAFMSEAGHVQFSDLDVGTNSFDADSGRLTTTRLGADASRRDTYARSFVASLSAYLDAVRHSAPAPVGIEAGLRELQVEAAIARSIKEQRPIDVQQELPIVD